MAIATRNPAKKERYKSLLSKMAQEVLGLDELSIKGKPNETGITAEENAQIKARFYASKTGLPVFAEDEALYVDFLPAEKQPGVFVRRIDGEIEANDDKLLSHWESIISRTPEERRTGRWHFAFCLATPDGNVNIVSYDRVIMFFSPPSKMKNPGWPLSSIQGPLKFKKPHIELTEEEKQSEDAIILNKLERLFNKE